MKTIRQRAALFVVICFFTGAAFALASLPDIPGYSAGAVRSVSLDAPSGNFGIWLSRTYTTTGGRILEATLLSGPGAGPLVSGPVGTRTDDRPIGFGSTYEVFVLDVRRAVFEQIPNVGSSLVVEVDEDVTLTLESSSLLREELEEAARRIIESL